jgi:hypothetical protein
VAVTAFSSDRSMHGDTLAEAGNNNMNLYLVNSRPCVRPAADRPETLVGRQAPDLRALGLSSHEGKPMVICFWNSAEYPSQAAISELSAKRAGLAAQGVMTLGVVAFARNPEHLRDWLSSHSIDMPMGVVTYESPTDYTGMVRCLERWAVGGQLPWFIAVDQAGVVQAEGFQLDRLDEAVKTILQPETVYSPSATQPAQADLHSRSVEAVAP